MFIIQEIKETTEFSGLQKENNVMLEWVKKPLFQHNNKNNRTQ